MEILKQTFLPDQAPNPWEGVLPPSKAPQDTKQPEVIHPVDVGETGSLTETRTPDPVIKALTDRLNQKTSTPPNPEKTQSHDQVPAFRPSVARKDLNKR